METKPTERTRIHVSASPLHVGTPVLIRTVTSQYIGVIVEVVDQEAGKPVGGYVLNKCSRFPSQESFEMRHYLQTQRVFINGQHIVEAVEWEQALPGERSWQQSR